VRKATIGTDADDEVERPLVDGSLIDEMLRLSPVERLRQNDRMAALAAKLTEAFARAGDHGRAA
jgi:hypothetical protein